MSERPLSRDDKREALKRYDFALGGMFQRPGGRFFACEDVEPLLDARDAEVKRLREALRTIEAVLESVTGSGAEPWDDLESILVVCTEALRPPSSSNGGQEE